MTTVVSAADDTRPRSPGARAPAPNPPRTAGTPAAEGPVVAAQGGVRVAVRLTPKAARDRVDGIVEEADGRRRLKVAVTAVPEDGKANAALVRLLAKEWRLARTTLSIVSGATDRRKTVHVAGETATLLTTINDWIRQKGHD